MNDTIRVIHSQIGYDTGRTKKAYVAGTLQNGSFRLTNAITKQTVLEGPVCNWGEKWNENWHSIDLTPADLPGEYTLEIFENGELAAKAESPVHIGRDILWNQCWHAISFAQLDVRAANCYPVGGWRDCGSELQEVSSHIIMLDALCDLWTDARLPEFEREHLLQHILRGADYILCCQQEHGGFVHEVKHNPSVSFGNCANAVAVLARVAALVKHACPEKAVQYLHNARRGYDFAVTHDFFKEQTENESLQITHGAPEGMDRPPNALRTRDLLSLLDATLSLHNAGVPGLEDKAIALTEEIFSRQIPEEKAEYGLYGHFYTYPGYEFSEKANYHCGAWDLPYKNYNQGAHKPYWVLPLFEMTTLFPRHPRVSEWKKALHSFAYGFFLPACGHSPFGILPAGVYTGQGVLHFSGWYHGHAKIYGYTAVLAARFYKEWNDLAFLELAEANLQWVAGLNVQNVSLAVGIGDRSVKDWDALRGTIVNGFDASKQFSIAPVSKETDLPTYLDDEGGIHHCAGFVAGLCAMGTL
ncbi:MAG: glycoside hydrolase family 9 protein [Clostridia bacterium]|nr:glycoside hydrolase family 9 protein [Clostridia bacterium]